LGHTQIVFSNNLTRCSNLKQKEVFMVQSVKSNLQLFFAAVGLAAIVMVTMGNAPPEVITPKKFLPTYVSAPEQCVPMGDVSRVWSLTHLLEGRKYVACENREARLTDEKTISN